MFCVVGWVVAIAQSVRYLAHTDISYQLIKTIRYLCEIDPHFKDKMAEYEANTVWCKDSQGGGHLEARRGGGGGLFGGI